MLAEARSRSQPHLDHTPMGGSARRPGLRRWWRRLPRQVRRAIGDTVLVAAILAGALLVIRVIVLMAG